MPAGIGIRNIGRYQISDEYRHLNRKAHCLYHIKIPVKVQ